MAGSGIQRVVWYRIVYTLLFCLPSVGSSGHFCLTIVSKGMHSGQKKTDRQTDRQTDR